MVAEKRRKASARSKTGEFEYIRDKRGRKTAAVVPIREYNELREDLHDLAMIIERRDEPTESWEEVKRILKADGLLPD